MIEIYDAYGSMAVFDVQYIEAMYQRNAILYIYLVDKDKAVQIEMLSPEAAKEVIVAYKNNFM